MGRHQGVDHGGELPNRILHLALDEFDLRGPSGVVGVEHLTQDLVLAAEVVDDSALAEPEGVSHCAEAGVAEALLGDELSEDSQDRVPRTRSGELGTRHETSLDADRPAGEPACGSAGSIPCWPYVRLVYSHESRSRSRGGPRCARAGHDCRWP